MECSLVSDVTLDGEKATVIQASNTQISNLGGGEHLSWEQLDKSLPFPLDPNDKVLPLVLKCSTIVEDINQELLKITHLKSTSYELRIDGTSVGTFSKEQLESGINLATLSTPMAAQALKVLKLTRSHTDIHQLRWRTLQSTPIGSDPDLQGPIEQLMDDCDQTEQKIVAIQHATCQPVSHKYELNPGH